MTLQELLDEMDRREIISGASLKLTQQAVNAHNRYAKDMALTDAFQDRSMSCFARHMQRNQKLGSYTAKLYTSAIRRMWKFAYRNTKRNGEDWCHKKPPKKAEMPCIKLEKRVPEAWTAKEIAAMLVTVKNMNNRQLCADGGLRKEHWLALLLMAYDTGWRVSKTILNLRWEHIDGDVIRTPASIDKCHKADIKRVSKATMDALKVVRLMRRTTGRVRYVFPWNKSHSHFRSIFRKIVKKSGVRPGGLHRIRKSHASAVAKSAGLFESMRSLNHSDVRSTKMYIDPQIAGTVFDADKIARPGIDSISE